MGLKMKYSYLILVARRVRAVGAFSAKLKYITLFSYSCQVIRIRIAHSKNKYCHFSDTLVRAILNNPITCENVHAHNESN